MTSMAGALAAHAAAHGAAAVPAAAPSPASSTVTLADFYNQPWWMILLKVVVIFAFLMLMTLFCRAPPALPSKTAN